jgi:hypothetical protein
VGSRKAEKLQKHKKEIRRKSILNLFLVVGASLAVGIFVIGPISSLADLLIGGLAVQITSSLITVFLLALYLAPILHFKEENKLESNKHKEYYLDQALDQSPMIQYMEEMGLEVVEKTENRVKLETSPSRIHEKFGWSNSIEIETIDERETEETVIIRRNGEDFEKVRTKVEEKEEGCKVEETGVSLKRHSASYMELMMLLYPAAQRKMLEVADEELELLDEDISVGLSKFSIESE